jgi:hypothetical protein
MEIPAVRFAKVSINNCKFKVQDNPAEYIDNSK